MTASFQNQVRKEKNHGDSRRLEKYTFRPWTLDDAELIANQRDEVFLEMQMDPGMVATAREYYIPWLKDFLMKDFYKGYAIVEKTSNKVVGGGAIWVGVGGPSPMVLSSDLRRATVTNVFVDKAHRRQGLARSLLQRLIALAKADGYLILELRASEAGRHLYETSGFQNMNQYHLLL